MCTSSNKYTYEGRNLNLRLSNATTEDNETEIVMNNNCDCYRIESRKKYTYNPLNGEPVTRNITVGVCWGTKEMEECSCDGDKSKCNFYPELRAEATKQSKKIYLYAARDIETGKLVSDLTNPRRKYWDKEGNARIAIDAFNRRENYQGRSRHYHGEVELVKFELVEVPILK